MTLHNPENNEGASFEEKRKQINMLDPTQDQENAFKDLSSHLPNKSKTEKYDARDIKNAASSRIDEMIQHQNIDIKTLSKDEQESFFAIKEKALTSIQENGSSQDALKTFSDMSIKFNQFLAIDSAKDAKPMTNYKDSQDSLKNDGFSHLKDWILEKKKARNNSRQIASKQAIGALSEGNKESREQQNQAKENMKHNTNSESLWPPV